MSLFSSYVDASKQLRKMTSASDKIAATKGLSQAVREGQAGLIPEGNNVVRGLRNVKRNNYVTEFEHRVDELGNDFMHPAGSSRRSAVTRDALVLKRLKRMKAGPKGGMR